MGKRDPEKTTPQRPEERPAARPERDKEDIEREPDAHQGATEEEVTRTTPPMRGPGDLTGETDSDDDEIDPSEELTPG